MTLLEAANLTEDEAREYMEKLRWPNGPECPHCGSQNHTRLEGDAHRAGVIQCNECRKQYTVTVGSVMEKSKVPLKKWVMGFHLMCSSKKGISALQLQRELGLGSYRTAWFMAHRIRYAMHMERDGDVKAKPIERVDAKTLKGEIRKNVDASSTIMTDEHSSYTGIGEEYEGGHHVVAHGGGEYSREESGLKINSNTVESFFGLIKRGHYGVFHQLSKQHLHRYISEFEFRWNTRKLKDGERRDIAISQIGNKRLVYLRPFAA